MLVWKLSTMPIFVALPATTRSALCLSNRARNICYASAVDLDAGRRPRHNFCAIIASAAASSLRSFAPAISMMPAAGPGTRHHRRGRRRLAFYCPSIRRVLIEGIVNPVVVMVVHVIANEPPQMSFV